jgi:hypothetical protein
MFQLLNVSLTTGEFAAQANRVREYLTTRNQESLVPDEHPGSFLWFFLCVLSMSHCLSGFTDNIILDGLCIGDAEQLQTYVEANGVLFQKLVSDGRKVEMMSFGFT